MQGLCRELARTLRAVPDDAGKPAFPTGGIRVLAYPSTHHVVADEGRDVDGGPQRVEFREPATERQFRKAAVAGDRRRPDLRRARRPVRPVRTDRHKGRRGKAEVRPPAARAE
ncbi:MAG: hypothetical protein ACO3TU_04910, partial [Burkholderiaceae bacterium]